MKTLKYLLAAVVPLVAVAGCALVISGAVPYRVYIVHTGSMTPTIPPKSAVIVRDGSYRVGQVVTFTEDGSVVTHRLVGFSTAGLTITKGDANRTVDPWHVPRSEIIGGVVAAPRQVGYWLEYLRNPVGLASVLLSLLACIEIWSLAGHGSDRPRHRKRTSPGRRRAAPLHRIGSNRSDHRAPAVRTGRDPATVPTWGSAAGAVGVFAALGADPSSVAAPMATTVEAPAWQRPDPPDRPGGTWPRRPMTVPSLVPSIEDIGAR